MMPRANILALATTLLILCACGFKALHGQEYQESLAVDLSSFSITVDGGSIAVNATSLLSARYSELLKAEILDKTNPLNTTHEKQFKLEITFTENDVPLFVNPDGTASRGDLVYNSTYRITRLADATLVASGTLNRTSSYNSSPTADYASYVSIQDARRRGIVELAQDYKFRLAALLPTLNDPEASAIEKKPSYISAPNSYQLDHSREIVRPGY